MGLCLDDRRGSLRLSLYLISLRPLAAEVNRVGKGGRGLRMQRHIGTLGVFVLKDQVKMGVKIGNPGATQSVKGHDFRGRHAPR